MSSVDKRRRERLRAKREQGQSTTSTQVDAGNLDSVEQLSRRPKPTPPDKHVVPADGRQARLKRRKLHQEANQSKAEGGEGVLPLPERTVKAPHKAASLRERREERRRQKLRRAGQDPHRPEARVRPMGVVWISWRWLSGTLIILLAIVLYVMLFSDIFVIDSMAVGGVRYLSREQIFEASGLANKHLFWVDPRKIEAQLEQNPSIASAQVFTGWPPNMVSIYITERDPALIWEQGDFRVWVDVNGIVMFQREEREDLLRVVYQDADVPLDVGRQIDRNIIAGALALKNMYPNIETLLYDPVKGLGYQDGRNWVVWFGTGTNMEIKAKVYDTIVRVNYPGVQFREIDVSDPDHPVFVDRFPTDE